MSFYPGRADSNNGVISVDQALEDPSVIAGRVADIASKNLLVESIFSVDSSPVSGGTVLFSKTLEKHLYMDEDASDRQPGDEYKVLYSVKPDLEAARVEDFGGKFATTDEARRRNQAVDFDNDVTRLANTITKKLNQRAIETVQAAEEAGETNQVAFVGVGWDGVNIEGDPTTITPTAQRPTAAIADAMATAEMQELGVVYKKMIVSPSTKASILTAYGPNLQAMLDVYGLDMIVSNYVEDNKTYLIDPGQAGFVKYEEPLTIHNFRDEHRRLTWTQGYAMPVMGITLPSAIATIEFNA